MSSTAPMIAESVTNASDIPTLRGPMAAGPSLVGVDRRRHSLPGWSFVGRKFPRGRWADLEGIRNWVAGRSPFDGLVLIAAALIVSIYVAAFLHTPTIGSDLSLYQGQVRAWLSGAPMYPPSEVAGPFGIVPGVILYPPVTIVLFIPTLLLPAPLWWLIPAAILAVVVYRLRPRGRWWFAMACCLLFPSTIWAVTAGNPDLWLVATLAVSIYWRPAAAFVLLKPSLFPLALLGIKSRGWWAIAAVFAVLSLALLPQTLDWLAVIHNGQDAGLAYHGPGLLYSLGDLPLLAVPLLAWAGSSRRQNASRYVKPEEPFTPVAPVPTAPPPFPPATLTEPVVDPVMP